MSCLKELCVKYTATYFYKLCRSRSLILGLLLSVIFHFLLISVLMVDVAPLCFRSVFPVAQLIPRDQNEVLRVQLDQVVLAKTRAPIEIPIKAVKIEGSVIMESEAPFFYKTGELSVSPVALSEPVLDTDETIDLALSGTVVLKLLISDQGQVLDAMLESSNLPDLYVDVAKRAFIDLHFAPGEIDGKQVAVQLHVEVTYERDQFLVQ